MEDVTGYEVRFVQGSTRRTEVTTGIEVTLEIIGCSNGQACAIFREDHNAPQGLFPTKVFRTGFGFTVRSKPCQRYLRSAQQRLDYYCSLVQFVSLALGAHISLSSPADARMVRLSKAYEAWSPIQLLKIGLVGGLAL